MSNNNGNLHKDVLYLLKSYVQDEFRGDSFFINISGCSSELLYFIKENSLAKLDDIHVVALSATGMDFAFESVVKLRNNESIKKILVFSNTSLQSIESLKDFTQIYQDNLNYDTLWPHLKEMFLDYIILKFSALSLLLKTFIREVIAEIHPSLYELVEYLTKCKQEFIYNERKYNEGNVAFVFNSNLYRLGVWSSLSSDKLLNRKALKKIAANSAPLAIQKKLTAPRDIENFDDKNKGSSPSLFRERFPSASKQKRLLDRMFYYREYTDAFEQIAFEQMEPILKYTTRKTDAAKVSPPEEPLYSFENIYHMYLFALSGQSDITVTERQIADAERGITLIPDDVFGSENDDMEQIISYSYEHFSETKNDYISVDFTKAANKVEQFKKIFGLAQFNDGQSVLLKCRNLNIPDDDKIALGGCLETYLSERQKYAQKLLPSGTASFLRLHELLDNSRVVRQAFMELLKLLYNLDSSSIETIASVNFLNNILEIDFALNGEVLFVPIYSPIILFYLQIVQNRYQELLPDCENLDTNILETLETLNASVLNDCIPYNNTLYQLSDSNDFPYYVCFENISHLDSIRYIDFRSIAWPLAKLVHRFPYKHTLKLYIFGKINGSAVRACLESISNSYLTLDSNLSKVHITIASQNQKNVSDALSALLKRDASFDIEYAIETIENPGLSDLKRILSENDIVLFLDSRILYREPSFLCGNQSTLAGSLRYRSFEMEKSALPVSGRNAPVVPYAINALLNATVGGRLQEGEWNRYQLDMNLLGSINSALREQNREDRRIIIASGNTNLDEQIFDNENVLSIYEDVITGSEQNMKVLIFDCASKRRKAEYDDIDYVYNDKEGTKSICLNCYNLYRALNIYKSIPFSSFLSYFGRFISIDYEDFPKSISAVRYKDTASESEDSKEEFDLIFNNYFKRALMPRHHLDMLYKEIFTASLMQAANTLSDIIFVHYFSRLSCEQLTQINAQKGVRKFKMAHISSMEKNYLFRMLKFLDGEELSERTSRDFQRLLSTSKLDIKKLHQILDIARDANYSSKGYLVENLTKYFDGVQI